MFFRTIVYRGKVEKAYMEKRIRVYEEAKLKFSLSISYDPDSVKQPIRRANYQVHHSWVGIETMALKRTLKWDEEKRVVAPIRFDPLWPNDWCVSHGRLVQSLTPLFGRRSADPILFEGCVSALLRTNQHLGSHCHAHRCYGLSSSPQRSSWVA